MAEVRVGITFRFSFQVMNTSLGNLPKTDKSKCACVLVCMFVSACVSECRMALLSLSDSGLLVIYWQLVQRNEL